MEIQVDGAPEFQWTISGPGSGGLGGNALMGVHCPEKK